MPSTLPGALMSQFLEEFARDASNISRSFNDDSNGLLPTETAVLQSAHHISQSLVFERQT